jgi:hypothetical protein
LLERENKASRLAQRGSVKAPDFSPGKIKAAPKEHTSLPQARAQPIRRSEPPLAQSAEWQVSVGSHPAGCDNGTMPNRQGLSKKLRFEVFKRDSFTCQYCGGKAPDVLLHADHILALANGGKSTIINLITSCSDCNLGKGSRALSDSSALQKQRGQMEELNERRLQLEMMAEWRRGLDDLEEQKIDSVASRIQTKFLFDNRTINPNGRLQIAKWLRQFSMDEIFNAIDISAGQYLIFKDGKAEIESQETAFHYVPRICNTIRLQEKKPHIATPFIFVGFSVTD